MLKKVLLLGCALSSLVPTPSWSTLVSLSSGGKANVTEQTIQWRVDGHPLQPQTLFATVQALFAGPWNAPDGKNLDLSPAFSGHWPDLLATMLMRAADPEDNLLSADTLTGERLSRLYADFLSRDIVSIFPLVNFLIDTAHRASQPVRWRGVDIPAPQFVIPAACVLSAYRFASLSFKQFQYLDDPSLWSDEIHSPDGTIKKDASVCRRIVAFLEGNPSLVERLKAWLTLPGDPPAADVEHSFQKMINAFLDRLADGLGIPSEGRPLLIDMAAQLLSATTGCSVYWKPFKTDESEEAHFSAEKLKEVWQKPPQDQITLKSWFGNPRPVETFDIPVYCFFESLGLRWSEARLKNELGQKFVTSHKPTDAAEELLKVIRTLAVIADGLKEEGYAIVGKGLCITAYDYSRFAENCQAAIDSLLEGRDLREEARKTIRKINFIEEFGRFDLANSNGKSVFRWQGDLADRGFMHKGREDLEPLIDDQKYKEVWTFILKMRSVNRMINLIERAEALKLVELPTSRMSLLDIWKSPEAFGDSLSDATQRQEKILAFLRLFLDVSQKVRKTDYENLEQLGLAAIFMRLDGVTALDDFAHVQEALYEADYDDFFKRDLENVVEDIAQLLAAPQPEINPEDKELIELAKYYNSLTTRQEQDGFEHILFGQYEDFGMKKNKRDKLKKWLGKPHLISWLTEVKAGRKASVTKNLGPFESEEEQQFILNHFREESLVSTLNRADALIQQGRITLGDPSKGFREQMSNIRIPAGEPDVILRGLAQGIIDLSNNVKDFLQLRQEEFGEASWLDAKERLLADANRDKDRDVKRFEESGKFLT